MISDFNSDRQEVWYLETSTLTVADWSTGTKVWIWTLFTRLIVPILPRLRTSSPHNHVAFP
jgi:hypothetical protein